MAKEEEGLPKKRALDSREVFHWPEFILFCERAGIVLDLGIQKLVINLEEGCALQVVTTYFPKGIPGSKGDES